MLDAARAALGDRRETATCDVVRLMATTVQTLASTLRWWSSDRRPVGDAWGHGGEEGRGKRRYAGGSGTHAMSPGCPNGETRLAAAPVITSDGEANPGN